LKLCDFLEFGWPLGVNREVLNSKQGVKQNHKGALEFSVETDDYIKKERGLGALIGPFTINPLSIDVFTSPINSIPKAGCSDRRFITDLSFPKGGSINDGIEKDYYLGDYFKLSYPTVDSLISMIKVKGEGSMLYKRDLSRAYRQFPLDPGDIHLQGIYWREELFIDCALVMGCRAAAMMCQRATGAVAGFMCYKGIDVCAYLDDFAGCSDSKVAESDFLELGGMLSSLGLKESIRKAHAPSTRMEFLGILFDTVKMTVEITESRLVEIRVLLSSWLSKRSASKVEIQMLIGKLQFAAKCVPAGRLFISRLLEVLRGLKQQHHRVRLSIDFKRDIQWWNSFMARFNGVSMMLDEQWSLPDSIISTDACLTGGGGWIQGRFFSSVFPVEVLDLELHINALELLTLLVSLKLWCPLLSGKRIQVFCDNEATVTVINSGRCKDRYMLRLLREIVFLCSLNNCWIRAVHIPGVDNRLADRLSRSHKMSQEKVDALEFDLRDWSRTDVCTSHFTCRDEW